VSLEAKDLRGNEPDELRSTARKLQEDLFKHRLKKTTSQLENTMLIRQTRRDIARVYTVLAERVRQIGGGAAPSAAKATANDTSPETAKEPAKASAKAAAKATTKDHTKDTKKKPAAKKPAAKQADKKES
jgi:large subunit ribosomal protein L29